MGTIKQGILGGFSGKVGTVVGSTWKSVHYMRALAVSFSDPRTEKQKNQRSKFTAAVNFTKAMAPFLRFGYKEFSGQQSAFNVKVKSFASYLLAQANNNPPAFTSQLLNSGKFQYLFYCCIQSVNVLSTCCCKVRLAAAAALNQFGGFFHQISGFQSTGYKVIT